MNENPTTTPNQQGSNIDPHIAAALSYLLSWITGILFFVIEKDKFVRFHAAQSIVLGLVFTIIMFAASALAVLPLINIIAVIAVPFIQLGGFLLMLFAAWKAYNKVEYEIPYIGVYARKILEKN